jgi:hypothetical protein
MTIPKGKGQVTVAFQEECENCQWPAVDNRFLPDVDTMPAPLPGTVWMEARELRTGMQVRLGFSYALTVTDVQIRSGEGNQPDRTYLTVAPPARCGDPFDLHCCADAPMCVEGTR